ncbi:MAG: type II secretion system protein GspM [Paracoccaceae bacterium]
MTAFWTERTAREKLLLGLLLVTIGLYAAFTAIWQPLQQQRSALLSDIARYDRVATMLNTLSTTGLAPAPATSDMPLPTLITTSADSYQLSISRILPTESVVDITLAEAPFDIVIGWVQALEQDHGLRIQALTMTRKPEPGLVATTLIIGR